MPDRIRCLFIVVALLAAQVSSTGQSVPPRAQPAGPPPSGASTPGVAGAMVPGPDRTGTLVDPDRKLQPGDQLSLEIEEDREIGPLPKIVTATGEVDVYPLGKIRIAGMTTTVAANTIKRQLEIDYYHKATIRLSIDRVNLTAQIGSIVLSGEVRQVGTQSFYLEKPPMLSEEILNAGNFTMYANQRKVRVTRQNPGGAPSVQEIDVKTITEKGRMDLDIKLQDGDRINVPRRGVIW